jgi:organic radical activating enzyme
LTHTLLSYVLPVVEIYTSADADPPMTFVVLAGPYDTEYCRMGLVKITSFIPPGIRHVCITGGEPISHGDNLSVLLSELTFQGLTIHLETSGAIDPPHYWKSNDHIRWSFK